MTGEEQLLISCIYKLIALSRSSDSSEDLVRKQARQPSVSDALKPSGKEVSQGSVDKAIVTLVVNKMLPFSLVEAPEFKALVSTLNLTKSLIARKFLFSRITEKYRVLEANLIRYRN